jgi:hypothetical protein
MFRQRTKYRKKGTPGEGGLGEKSAERKTALLGFGSQRLRAGLTCVTPPAFVLGTAKEGVLRGRVGHPPSTGKSWAKVRICKVGEKAAERKAVKRRSLCRG